jgi:hypothetical protein
MFFERHGMAICKVRKLCLVFLLFAILFLSACSVQRLPVTGQRFVNTENENEQIIFPWPDEMVYTWPCDNNYNIACPHPGKTNSRRFYCIVNRNEIQLVLTSFDAYYFPYNSQFLIPDENETIVPKDKFGKVKTFILK